MNVGYRTVLGAIVLTGMFASSAISKELPFQGGAYLPSKMAKYCSDSNLFNMDWTVVIDSKKGLFGDNEGLCKVVSVSRKGAEYTTSWSCNSQGEKSKKTIIIRSDGPRGKVRSINGAAYSYCGPAD